MASDAVVANLIGGPYDGERREVPANEPLVVERRIVTSGDVLWERGEYRPIGPLLPGSVVKVHGWTFRGWREASHDTD